MTSKIMGRFTAIALIFILMLFAGCNTKTPTATSTPVTSTTAVQPSVTPPQTTPPKTTLPVTTTTLPPTTKTQLPAQVSGLVYYRDPAISYPVNAAPAAYVLEGAAVSIGGYHVATGVTGQYRTGHFPMVALNNRDNSL